MGGCEIQKEIAWFCGIDLAEAIKVLASHKKRLGQRAETTAAVS